MSGVVRLSRNLGLCDGVYHSCLPVGKCALVESVGAASCMADRLWITCRHQHLARNIVPCPAPSPTLWHRLGVPS